MLFDRIVDILTEIANKFIILSIKDVSLHFWKLVQIKSSSSKYILCDDELISDM